MDYWLRFNLNLLMDLRVQFTIFSFKCPYLLIICRQKMCFLNFFLYRVLTFHEDVVKCGQQFCLDVTKPGRCTGIYVGDLRSSENSYRKEVSLYFRHSNNWWLFFLGVSKVNARYKFHLEQSSKVFNN